VDRNKSNFSSLEDDIRHPPSSGITNPSFSDLTSEQVNTWKENAPETDKIQKTLRVILEPLLMQRDMFIINAQDGTQCYGLNVIQHKNAIGVSRPYT
jgi:hypothetical protein